MRNSIAVAFLILSASRVEASAGYMATASLTATASNVSGSAATATLPGVTGLFHYITSIVVQKYVGAAITASATPIIVTTTNLNNYQLTFRNVGAVADMENEPPTEICIPVRSAALGVATTFVAPATTGVKWIIMIIYYLDT